MTKMAIKERASLLLKKWADYGCPTDPWPITDPEDHSFLESLISGHINKRQKVGTGIHCFFVGKSIFGSSCFFIRRTDFSETDFGIQSCLKNRRAINLSSFRQIVWPEIERFRKTFTGPTFLSEFSGKTFNISELHIDHTPPWTFLKIVDVFCGENKIDISGELTKSVDNSFVPVFSDTSMPDRFILFHNSVATLRPVSSGENTGEIKNLCQ